MMTRPAPINRRLDGMLPAEKKLAIHVMLAAGDWPEEARANLVDHIVQALDEAFDAGVEATLAANETACCCGVDGSVVGSASTDASIEALARTALVLDVGGGP